MATASTAISLSQTYFLRDYYSNNRGLVTSSNRTKYTNSELSFEDSLALRRAVKKLGGYSYTDSENSESIANAITGFIKTYNNTIGSAGTSSDHDILRQAKRLKKYVNDNSDTLSKLGITVQTDGTLSCSENLLKKADKDDLKSAFGKDSKFLKNLTSTAKRLHTETYDNLYSQMTGSGNNINLVL